MPMPAAPKAGVRPDVGAVESGSSRGVPTDDSESFALFRGLTQAFPYNSNRTSSSASHVDSQVAGPSVDADMDPKFQQPPWKKILILTSEQQIVDLGEVTRFHLSQAYVMISAASTICLITAV